MSERLEILLDDLAAAESSRPAPVPARYLEAVRRRGGRGRSLRLAGATCAAAACVAVAALAWSVSSPPRAEPGRSQPIARGVPTEIPAIGFLNRLGDPDALPAFRPGQSGVTLRVGSVGDPDLLAGRL